MRRREHLHAGRVGVFDAQIWRQERPRRRLRIWPFHEMVFGHAPLRARR